MKKILKIIMTLEFGQLKRMKGSPDQKEDRCSMNYFLPAYIGQYLPPAMDWRNGTEWGW
jgi:hypothetical protein